MFFVILTMMIFYIFISQTMQIEAFTLSPTFVSPDYMISVVYKQSGAFFDNMNPSDLYARKVQSIKDYKRIYSTSFRPFTANERAMIAGYVETCDKRVAQTHRLKAIPWKFAKLDKNIEHGWPHTLGDVIILPSDFLERGQSTNAIIDTLIHEKVHVYQRVYEDLTLQLLRGWGFTRTQTPSYLKPYMRSNPDLVGFFQYQGKAPVQLYNKIQPASIADSRVEVVDISAKELTIVPNGLESLPFPLDVVRQTEHPFEVMATLIPIILLEPDRLPKDNYITNVTINWCKQYL